MNLDAFVESVDLLSKSEIQKVKYLFYYFFRREGLSEAGPPEVRHWFDELNLGRPNISRLTMKIKSSAEFIQGSSPTKFRLHAKTIKSLVEEIPSLSPTLAKKLFLAQ